MEEEDDLVNRAVDDPREMMEIISDAEGVFPGFAEVSAVDVRTL